MTGILNFPLLVFALSLIALWCSASIGGFIRQKMRPLHEDQRKDFGVVQAAALTLLGLLIGFAFSMAVSRYDQRRSMEEAEANAIGTEYLRADLLPAADGARIRQLLIEYLDQRISFYDAVNAQQLQRINTVSAQLEDSLWSAIQTRATAQPTPVVALAVSGMNDVLDSQGFTQAAWWNRIPAAAWVLLAAIAVCCNLLIGYGAHQNNTLLFMIFPLAVAVSFFLIADIDSPRGGVIRVHPQNLTSLSQSLHARATAPPHD
jgi:hypothetical protein